MSHKFEIVARATINISDEDYAYYQALAKDYGQEVSDLVVEESSAWWTTFTNTAEIEANYVGEVTP